MLPDYFGSMLLGFGVMFVVVLAALWVLYKVIDYITPGCLCDELLGRNSSGKPNVALALVAGSMFVGAGLALGFTVLGVLTH